MLAGGQLIEKCFETKIWSISTADGSKPHIGPNSVDVRLNNQFLIMKSTDVVIDPTKDLPKKLYEKVTSNEITLKPGDFVLASVLEKIDCSGAVGIETEGVKIPLLFTQHYEGRSTLARLGLLTHISAGFGDFGFKGAFTLEIKNLGNAPILLKKGMRVGQVYFQQVIFPKEYKGYDQTDYKPATPILGKGRF